MSVLMTSMEAGSPFSFSTIEQRLSTVIARPSRALWVRSPTHSPVFTMERVPRVRRSLFPEKVVSVSSARLAARPPVDFHGSHAPETDRAVEGFDVDRILCPVKQGCLIAHAPLRGLPLGDVDGETFEAFLTLAGRQGVPGQFDPDRRPVLPPPPDLEPEARSFRFHP